MTVAVPVVTVIVPTRDEVDDIEGCLAAIAAQDHPLDRLEVIVVDGCSADGTAEVARRALSRYGFGSTAVLTNGQATTPSNLNVGLAEACGELICRVDARTRIEPHYVRTCADILMQRPEVAVVGGAQIAIARDARARSVGIARALNNRWSMGGSAYRRASESGSSDTVYLGAFRRADLIEVGGWDERLRSNQDFDLNRRMSRRGLVWFEGSLRSGYLPRQSIGQLWAQYRRFGRAKVVYWRATGDRPQPRQLAMIAGPPALALVAASTAMAGPRRLPALGMAVAGALVAIESFGTREPSATPSRHVVAAAIIPVVAGGWWWGWFTEALRPSVPR